MIIGNILDSFTSRVLLSKYLEFIILTLKVKCMISASCKRHQPSYKSYRYILTDIHCPCWCGAHFSNNLSKELSPPHLNKDAHGTVWNHDNDYIYHTTKFHMKKQISRHQAKSDGYTMQSIDIYTVDISRETHCNKLEPVTMENKIANHTSGSTS